MPSYLDEEEEARPPIDDAEEADDERKQRLQRLLGTRPLYGSAPPFNPAEPPVPGRAPAQPDIDLPEAVPSGPGAAPVVADRNRTADDLARAISDKPNAPKPKWWQRAAAGAVGAAAGYANAAGRTKVDAAPAVEGILGGTNYKAKLSDWQNRVGGAQARADAGKTKEEAWWKNRSIQNDEDYKQAQEGRLNAQAEREAGRNDADAAKAKQADAEKQDALALRGREDAYLLKQGEQPPDGWDSIQSMANPGRTYAAPPRLARLPPELVDYAPGRKAGDVVPMNELKAARGAAQKDTLAQNRPVRPPAENVDRILLNPGDYTPEQVKQAREMFGQIHRPPASAQNRDAVAEAIERTAQALAAGDMTQISKIASLRGDQRLLLFDRAKQLNPKFNTAEVDRKIKMEDYYANGKGAANLQSFGTFLEHGGAAIDAASAINQGNPRLLNKPINWWKANMSGDPTFQAFTVALEPVRKEFEGFLLGGRALYGDDRKQAEIILNDSSSMGQVQAALKQMGHTAQARMNEENFRYKKVMGHDLTDPFSPEALEGARKIGVNLGGGQGAQQSGAGGSPPPQGAVHFVDAGVSYDIPAEKVQAFIAAHPKAKKGG